MKRSPMPASKILPRRDVPMKPHRPKSTPARRAAKDMPCQVRVPGHCNGDAATSVLAHYRLAGYSGVGLKPSDDMGAIACAACHDVIDGRVKTSYSRTELRLMHAEGVMRTRELLTKGNAA